MIAALSAYFTAKQNKLNALVEKNALTPEELDGVKAELEAIKEFLEGLDPEAYEGDATKLKEEIVAKLSEVKNAVADECKEMVENSFRLLAIANEANPSKKAKKSFAKVYENQIEMLKTQLGVQTFKNAITITPAGSLPVPTGVDYAQPNVILPRIFDFAEEDTAGKLLEGSRRGAKLRIIKISQTGNVAEAIGEGVVKPITEATFTQTDVTPLKVAVVIENVTVEQLEFNNWLEDLLKTYCSQLLFNNLEAATVGVLAANSIAYDGTSAAASVTKAFLENVAVAGAVQLASAKYFGKKVAFVNEGDWAVNLNAQTTTAYPVENKKIAEHIEFIPSGAVPSGTMYVADSRYIKKRTFDDVFIQRAVSHTHDEDGNREYTNGTDFIFDLLAFFYVTDGGAVVKLDIPTVAGVIEI